MEFTPVKSELMHFTRTRRTPTAHVRIGDTEIHPKQEARFLGVWLDRRLKWKAHLKKIETKLGTQRFALTRLAASAWGCSLVRAREIYTKVIRSVIAYGVGIWYQPS